MDEDELLAAALEVLQRRAAQRSAPSLTVAALYAKYEAANRTRKCWPEMANKISPALAAFGDRHIDSMTVLDWTTHAQTRRETLIPGKHAAAGRCYSDRTIGTELDMFKAMANWAVTQGLIRYNPIAGAKKPKTKKRRETAPAEWEIGQALAACETDQQRVMVLCAADAGMRRGEIRQLRHDWVDHEAKTIALPGWACKGGRGGTIPATQRLLDAIASLPRHIRLPQVLVSPRGPGPYSTAALNLWWVGIRERAGLQAAPGDGKPRLHDCRAAAATNALARGVRLETVSRRILRHASLQTTQIYLRGDVGDLDQAIEAMETGILRDQRRAKRIEPPPPNDDASKSKGG